MSDHFKNATTSTFHHCCENTNKNLLTIIQSNKKKSSFSTCKKISLLLRRSFSKSRNPNENKHSSKSIIATNIQLPITNKNNNIQNNNLNQNETNLTFIQRIKLHKGLRTGNISAELLKKKLLLKKEQSSISLKSKKIDFFNCSIAKKTLPSDVIYEANKTTYVTEALFALADSQPIVARSTPKHTTSLEHIYNKTIKNSEQNRNKKKIEERLKKNCLYETNVYDQMLDDSLLICNMLQTHLNDCINGVRAQSPNILTSPFTSPPTTPILSKAQSSQLLHYEKINSTSTNLILDKKIKSSTKVKQNLVSTFDKTFFLNSTIKSNSSLQITKNFINRQQKTQNK